MPNFGFAIDNRSCIGCHACSTACKSENEVPLSVNRTWVKYVEAGAYPDTRRHFQVTRCNHCENPPCVRICPTQAMYQRADGIVEFDSSLCIGCKACMQACPYDAIYVDPNSNTAAKCHFCAHRVDLGMEPACVVVCPTHSIIAGDMDDPSSEISRVLAHNKVSVRKPEQGTAPKVFYIDGADVTLHPTAVERTPESFMWADVIPLHSIGVMGSNGHNGHNGHTGNGHHQAEALAVSAAAGVAKSGAPLRAPQPQGTPWNGPIQVGGKMAEHMVQVAYNAQHKIPWHWPVPAYLVTKGLGTGLFIVLSLGLGLGLFAFDQTTFLVGGFLSLLFIAATTVLLIADLERPDRFFYMLIHPQWRSWLTRGAFLLISFSILAGLWWLLEAGAAFDLLPGTLAEAVRPFALWIGFPLAVGVAIYTAFLFGQAEGRDLWQSGLLPTHLLIQSTMLGGGALVAMDLFITMPPALSQVAVVAFVSGLILDLFVTLFGEFGMPHASEVAARAAHDISHGAYRNHFWWGSIGLGHVIPAALLLAGMPALAALAGICAALGMYFFEYAFVMAPQDVPNS